jgi:hypothetical protein
MIPIAVGVVVILAAGGAWVALNGGSRTGTDTPVDTTRVFRNTAGKGANPQTVDTGRQVAARPPAPPPITRTTQRQSGTGTRGLDSAHVADSLNTLLKRIDDLSGARLRDAALDIFNLEGVSNNNKALAAYLAATGWLKMSDSDNTCGWARRAVNLDRSSRAYAALQQAACGT